VNCWCKGKCPHIGRPQELLKRRQENGARLALRNSLTVAPLCIEANILLANMLCQTNLAHCAMEHLNRIAEKIEPGRLHFERGKIFRAGVHLDQAAQEFYQAMQSSPENPFVVSGLVGALEMAGHLDEAETICTAARAKFPAHIELRRLAAVIADAKGDAGAAAAVLDDSAAGAAPLSPVELLDKGRYLEKLGQYAEAWILWHQAKTTLREKFGHVYNGAFFQRQFSALREASTPPRPNFVRSAPPLETTPGPLFICGYPRSGTTLVESIFAAHSAIVAGDELMSLPDIIESLPAAVRVRHPYPLAMLASSLGENSAIAELLQARFIKGAQARIGFKIRPRTSSTRRPPKPLFFTDKMPLNELHLPLIRMLFPEAPVVRLQRHPLDVMVSCFSNWLVHGGFYASSLEICARHYRQVWELAAHHQAQFLAAGRPGFITLKYESLVEDQGGKTAEILAAVGLVPEPACKTFHKNIRTARTISYRQVQQPMNRQGVGRWQNFRAQLAPAVEILRPILEAEGYDS